MPIYTKTGDKGETSLFDGVRVKKYSPRVNTYGTFDELNAFISLSEKVALVKSTKEYLNIIQQRLFLLCAEIATTDFEKLFNKSDIITIDDITFLEKIIDEYSEKIPKVTNFVLLGRCHSSAQLHVARTICRRAERELIELSEEISIRQELVKYVNRLSDCLYIMARVEDEEYHYEILANRIVERYKKAIQSNLKDEKQQGKPIKEIKNLYEVAEQLINKAKQKANEMGIPVVISVVDESGQIIAHYRMENSLLISNEMATKKAYSAVAMKMSTKELGEITKFGEVLYQLETMSECKLVSIAGGIPIYYRGKLLGALGVSGGSLEQDQAIAEYALKF